MILVEKHKIKTKNPLFKELDNLCFLSKNLYNSTLYTIRQHYFETKNYLGYNKVNKLFTDTNQIDYRALPAKVSKMTQMLVDKNFKSFFSLLKLKQANKYDKSINIPNYLDKEKGRQIVNYTSQALSFKKKGYIKLSGTEVYIKTKLNKQEVEFIRLVPKNNLIVIEIGYNKQEKEHKDNNNIASIDLGVNNLITLVSNNSTPLIINGKPLKSINQYYNKKLAKLKSDLSKINRKTSNRLSKLHNKRENKIDDYLHKSSRKIVNHLVSNQITTLVIGYNKEWKQDINFSKVNNQNFVQIPFMRLINQLKYKCLIEGIKVEIQEESYTSRSSFLDQDIVPVFDKSQSSTYLFSGRRVSRGLYRSAKGILINADVNGALNILRKYLIVKVAWDELIYSDLVEVSSGPLIRICF